MTPREKELSDRVVELEATLARLRAAARQLVKEAEDAASWLDSIEWLDTTTAHDAEDMRHALEAAWEAVAAVLDPQKEK